MTRRRDFKPFLLAGVLALSLPAFAAPAQDIILHLRNGDRIAGTILSETTNEVTLSTSWIKQLVVPVAQIQSREIPLAASTATNAEAVAKARVPALATNAAPATATPFKHWKGEATVGTDTVRGATDQQLYFGKASLTYSRPYTRDPKEFFRQTFNYAADYGKTDGTLAANDMTGSSKTDFDVSRRIYVYNLGLGSYDEIRKIDLHYEDGPGAGYHLFTGTNFLVNTELGANYQVEERSDNTTTRSFYYRAAEDLTWKINKQMTFAEKFAFFPRVDSPAEYRSRFESDLSYALTLNLFLNLTVIDNYDTEPATGVPPNELEFRSSLGVKF